MATLRQQVAQHWRDREIARSETLSDAWQVFLAYAGRGAEIILFICMAISLVQMIPTITLNDTFTGVVFVIQMITLDVAGFGLNSLAQAVRRMGDEETARRAGTIGTCLIIIMIISMLSGGISRLFGTQAPEVKTWMGYIDDGLILIRVGMTVLYGKVMHSLRDSQQHMQTQVEDERTALREEITQLQTTLQSERNSSRDVQARLTTQIDTTKSEQAEKINDLSQQLAEIKTTLETRNAELSHVQNLLSHVQNESSLKAQQYGKNELSWKSEMQLSVNEAREEMKAQMKAEQQEEMKALREKIDALSRVNSELKAQVKGQIKTPVKPVKPLSSEKFDTKTFVFACLQENAEMKLSEIVRSAKMQGQELSEPTISRYRKEWRESSNESSLG